MESQWADTRPKHTDWLEMARAILLCRVGMLSNYVFLVNGHWLPWAHPALFRWSFLSWRVSIHPPHQLKAWWGTSLVASHLTHEQVVPDLHGLPGADLMTQQGFGRTTLKSTLMWTSPKGIVWPKRWLMMTTFLNPNIRNGTPYNLSDLMDTLK